MRLTEDPITDVPLRKHAHRHAPMNFINHSSYRIYIHFSIFYGHYTSLIPQTLGHHAIRLCSTLQHITLPHACKLYAVHTYHIRFFIRFSHQNGTVLHTTLQRNATHYITLHCAQRIALHFTVGHHTSWQRFAP